MRRGWILAAIGVVAFSVAVGQNTKQNLNVCLSGLSACDISQLSPAEIKSVSDASKARNLTSCVNGLSTCDPTRLGQGDVPQVQAMYARRNAKNCVDGLARCNPQRLNSADAALTQFLAFLLAYNA